MAWTKTKTAIVIGATTILGVGTTTIVVEAMRAIHVAHLDALHNIEGAWEGIMPLGGIGIRKGESTETRIVVGLSKVSGDYVANIDAIDLGRTSLPVAKVVYKFPNIQLSIYPRRNMVYQGGVNIPRAMEIDLNGLTLKRAPSPISPDAPLDESDFAPRTGSVLQGYWKGGIVLDGGRYPDGLGDRQLGNNWNGAPLDVSTTLPLDLKIAKTLTERFAQSGQPDARRGWAARIVDV